MKDSWLSIVEAATYLSVSQKTVTRALKSRKNPDLQIKKVGGRTRILKSSIDNLDQIRTR